MRAAISGNDEAYRRLLHQLSAALRSTVRSGLSRAGASGSEVDDVVQETLLAIHLKRHTWDQNQPLAPWVLAIARNKMIDLLRRRGRRVEVPIDAFAELLPAEPSPPQKRIDQRDLDYMLSQLRPRQREIVRSIMVEGNSIRDVAVRLAMTEGAIRVALHRGLKVLARQHMEEEQAE
jgi:RNA polymerase sigma-70 factor (ECF subfamily)